MGVKAFECPGCGAKLTPSVGQPTIRCAYCGTTSQVSWKGNDPWSQNAHVSSMAAESAARARKLVLATTVGSLVLGIGMAGFFALAAPSSTTTSTTTTTTTVPAMPTIPPPNPTPPAAAMNPAAAADMAIMGRLNAYVRTCINSLDDRILSSRARYRSWVDDDEGPKPGSRHVYGLYTFSDPSGCAEQVQAASTLAPRHPEMDEAAQAYVAAVQDLHGVIEEAERYYDRNDYLDDQMARGQALHGTLMNGFNRFIVAREGLIAHLDPAFESALAAREAALAPGDTRSRLLYDTMRGALEIARAANVHWREIGSIDHDSFAARVDGYQRQIDQLEDHVAEGDRDLQSYVQASQAFALAAKEVARRVDRGGGWSRGDRMMLDGVGSHWMVTGSPGAALGKYEDIADVRNIDPPLRYIAPTALLSDGY